MHDSAGFLIAALLGRLFSAPCCEQPSAIIAIDREPMYRVHQGEHLSEFGTPTSAAMSPSGDVVVVDAISGQLLVVAASGDVRNHVRATGRGPSELASIASACLLANGDALVLDPSMLRVMRVDRKGRVAQIATVPAPVPHEIVCAVDGSDTWATVAFSNFAADVKWRGAPRSPMVPMRATVRIQSWRGAIAHRVHVFEGATSVLAVGGGGFPTPLGPRVTAAIDSEHLFIASGDSASISVLHHESTRKRLVRYVADKQRPTESEVAMARERSLNSLPVVVRNDVAELLNGFEIGRTIASHHSLVLGPEGRLWLQLRPSGGRPARVLGLDPSGARPTETMLPAGMTLVAKTNDRVLLRSFDVDGVEQLTVHRIKK